MKNRALRFIHTVNPNSFLLIYMIAVVVILVVCNTAYTQGK